MAVTEASAYGKVTAVPDAVVLAAPAVGVRRILRTLIVSNRDTAPVAVSIFLVDDTSAFRVFYGVLDANDTLYFDDPLVLNTTAMSIKASLSQAEATTQPDFVVTWLDQS